MTPAVSRSTTVPPGERAPALDGSHAPLATLRLPEGWDDERTSSVNTSAEEWPKTYADLQREKKDEGETEHALGDARKGWPHFELTVQPMSPRP